jgi:paraquat-inducible protein B
VSKKISTTMIGVFIITGLGLGVIGLLLFSSSRIFTKTREIIVYFDESLNGLSEGAPVKYRGVIIGSVKRVMVRFNQAEDDFAMPVILELEEGLIRERMDHATADLFSEESVARGKYLNVRASLQTESLVTGVLYVDIRPDAVATPPLYHQIKKIYFELPSEPTQIQQLFNNLARLDIKGIVDNLNMLITRLDTTIGELKMAEINRSITTLLASIDRFVSSPDLTNGLAALRPTLDQYRILGEKLNSRVDPLADSVTNSLAEATRTLAQIRGAAENLKAMMGPDSPVRTELDQALEQLAGAAQSMATLTDFLKQHPNALITGRESPKASHE